MFNMKAVSSIGIMMLVATVSHAEDVLLDFSVPTAYSEAIINQYDGATNVPGSISRWHLIDKDDQSTSALDQEADARVVMESCFMDIVDDIIIPKLNGYGFSLTSYEQIQELPIEEKREMRDVFEQNKDNLAGVVTTYTINCMHYNGYEFDSSPSSF